MQIENTMHTATGCTCSSNCPGARWDPLRHAPDSVKLAGIKVAYIAPRSSHDSLDSMEAI